MFKKYSETLAIALKMNYICRLYPKFSAGHSEYVRVAEYALTPFVEINKSGV